MLEIIEIFYSIQGEGTRTGYPCVFIRLAGCNLKCKWCDTIYAVDNYDSYSLNIEQVLNKVLEYNCNFIEITGGEPLLQDGTVELANQLIENGKTVAIETNGSQTVEFLHKNVIKIIDFKCPDSGMSQFNLYENIQYITPNDEIKFVIASKTDFLWSCEIIEKFKLYNYTSNILFSAVTPLISYHELADLILGCDNIHYKNIIRLQVQIHKVIWHPDQRGV